MDPIKKRKIEGMVPYVFNPLILTIDDARKIVELFTQEQLLDIVQNALVRHPDVLASVRSFADRDITQRKLFIRGLGSETTTEKLRALFSSYGELAEAVVILDKVTGMSKGFGFITYKHVDGAIMALKEPSKKIDGRMSVTQLASAGNSGGGGAGSVSCGGVNNPMDVSSRKIYVSNVPYDMPSDRLLQHFSIYGEVEEGPLGFDKATGKSKGFALFVYKTSEAARKSLVDPMKNIEGHQLNCKLAIDGKKGKPPGVGSVGPMDVHVVNKGNEPVSTMSGGKYGGPGGVAGNYGGFSVSLGTGVGGQGLSAVGNQAVGSDLGVGGGFGSGVYGRYSGGPHISGPMPTAYGGLGGRGVLGPGAGLGVVVDGEYAGVGAGLVGGVDAAGRGSSWYGLPPGSAGMGSGDYPHGGHYSVISGGNPGQHNQALSAIRVPPGGAYQGMPPYY